MIRVVLPAHLRTLARVTGEVTLEVEGEITQRSVLDALTRCCAGPSATTLRTSAVRSSGSSPASRICPMNRRTPLCGSCYGQAGHVTLYRSLAEIDTLLA